MAERVVVLPAPFGPTSATFATRHAKRYAVKRRYASVVHAESSIVSIDHPPAEVGGQDRRIVSNLVRGPDADRLSVVEDTWMRSQA